ncbi:MAG: type II toxin-antitoxin system RelE/ParE family toxin [Propionivibrio sp.]
MGRVFKTRHFSRWMRKTELTNHALCLAVAEMAQGLVDADPGGGVVKKRVGLAGRGKRGGARTLVATNKGDRWFFVFGFGRMSEPVSLTTSWMLCRISPRNYWPEPDGNWTRQ